MKNFFKKLMSSKSQSKYFSETVQRVGKNNAGFSLVELIVVIAIMAILAAVAVIGVSVYIPKAQKAADEQMVADIKTAVDLYANLESVQPGQSGYIVIHKNGGGESGNVSIGGAMDTFLTDAVVATFGEKYGTELKVSYGEWSGTFSTDEMAAIQNSVFIKNVYGSDDGILETVDMLTDAMKGFYTDLGVENPQQEANGAILSVAAGTKSVINKDNFIAWWTDGNLESQPNNGQWKSFNFTGEDLNEELKIELAARYARDKAFVMFTNCPECVQIFGTSSNNPFENVKSSSEAFVALDQRIIETKAHIQGTDDGQACQTCMNAFSNYFSETGSAKSDAEAYIAMLGQIDGMSDQIKNSPEYKNDGLYTSGFVKDIVNEYMTSVDSYKNTNAGEGDIVVTVIVDRNGNIQFKTNLPES